LHLVGILFPHINYDARSKSHQMIILSFSFAYHYVAVRSYRSVRCLIIIYLYLLFSKHFNYIFQYSFCLRFVSYFCFLFNLFCVFISFCVLFLLLRSPFPIFVQIYLPLPSGGNPTAVNKYRIISYRHVSVTSRAVGMAPSTDTIRGRYLYSLVSCNWSLFIYGDDGKIRIMPTSWGARIT